MESGKFLSIERFSYAHFYKNNFVSGELSPRVLVDPQAKSGDGEK